jgi:hypothetical protein
MIIFSLSFSSFFSSHGHRNVVIKSVKNRDDLANNMLVTMLLLVLLKHLSKHVEDSRITVSETFFLRVESLDFRADTHEHVSFSTFSKLEERFRVLKSGNNNFSDISKKVLDHSVFIN